MQHFILRVIYSICHLNGVFLESVSHLKQEGKGILCARNFIITQGKGNAALRLLGDFKFAGRCEAVYLHLIRTAVDGIGLVLEPCHKREEHRGTPFPVSFIAVP